MVDQDGGAHLPLYVLRNLYKQIVKKKKKTFVLVGWKARDLPKRDIWPIFSDNEKKTIKVLSSWLPEG
jgi:hypothetical protein